jgi:hypothetical protein
MPPTGADHFVRPDKGGETRDPATIFSHLMPGAMNENLLQNSVTMLARNPNYRKSMREFAGKFMGPPGDKLFNCGAGHGACVDAYGQAQMCMGLRHPEMVYDLRDDCHCEERSLRRSNPHIAELGIASQKTLAMTPLRYALTEFFPRLRELRATNPDYLNRCARCFLKGLCEQCPAKSWQEHGTLDTPVEYLCDAAHAQARYLSLLDADERAWEVERAASRERVARFVGNSLTPLAAVL